ncbi:MAG: 2-oxoacid:acceptor oxidoreductase family protein [Spirochaetota bacterium]|nr:2-oxoacid:acceptor oxidoreductase family protein [Spirochaetota bacterium]
MEGNYSNRDELLIAGIGGMGVLLIGSLLASAAFEKYQHVSWLPSYGVQPRGGLSECTVIFSEERISSPLLDQAHTVILIDGTQYGVMEPRVRSGGIMIVDNSGMKDDKTRNDIDLIALPAMTTVLDIFGEATASNLILLGAYIQTTNAMPAELIKEHMTKRFSKKEKLLKRNITAFEKGLELAAK